MEQEYEDDRTGWGDEMGRAQEDYGEDPLTNPHETLNECLEKFKTPDYIMEPGITAHLRRFFFKQFKKLNYKIRFLS